MFNRKPQLDQALQTALRQHPGGSDPASTLSDVDDVTISASYAPVGVKIGRSIAPHRPLVQAIVAKALPAFSNTARNRWEDFLRAHGREAPFNAVDVDDIRFESIADLALRGKAKDLVRAPRR